MKNRLPLILALTAGALAATLLFRGLGNRNAPDSTRKLAAMGAGADTGDADGAASREARDLHARYCKNPHATTCGTPWPSLDPTGKVRSDLSGEIRALRRMRNLIRENPSWTSEQVQEALARTIYSPKRRKRIEDGFAWVMTALRALVERQPAFSPDEKTAILAQLARITLELPPPASIYADAADLMTKNTVYYERTPKGALRLRVGGAYLLNTTSWYNVVYTLAHELAHAIDPCEAKHAKIFPKAYEGLVACLVSSGWVERERAECGPNEQVSEVFADWIAAQITASAITERGRDYTMEQRVSAAVNATRDLCDQASAIDSLNLKRHQGPKLRIGRIVGQCPAIRDAVGCRNAAPVAGYCRFTTPGVQARVEVKR